MAGKGVATWVKVKNSKGFTSRPISHKYEGGSGYEPGQVITMSEYQKLKAEGNQKRGETKGDGKGAIASQPNKGSVTVIGNNGKPTGKKLSPDVEKYIQEKMGERVTTRQVKLAERAVKAQKNKQLNTATPKRDFINKMNDVASQYGWNIKDGGLYNSRGVLVHRVEEKGGRIRLLSEGGKLRASLASPANIGSYLEKTFFAERK